MQIIAQDCHVIWYKEGTFQSSRNLKSGKGNWAQELRYGKKWFTETVTHICILRNKQECFSCPTGGETSVMV